ncbi:uncharacterized protein [Channa argus]|uniref:uncharacterized protein isoform X1 n=1 Tax=Channa argus TaxID=215402 RepID=UPI003520B259
MNVTMGNMILFAVFLLLSCQMNVFAGSTAVTPVFVQKGHDVLLEVKKDDVPDDFLYVVWKFREDVLVTFTPKSEPIVSENYTGRVEFSVENYSVKLKNLQETDTGLYTAQLTTSNKQQTLAEYKFTVQAISNGVIPYVAVAGAVGACLVFIVIILKCKRPIEQKNKENTIYAVPEDIVPAQNRIQTPAEDVSTVSPTSTYALVQFHTGPEKSQNTMNSSLPETVYAQVDRAAKSNARSLSSSNT